jgi:hypothetical protein
MPVLVLQRNVADKITKKTKVWYLFSKHQPSEKEKIPCPKEL